MNKHSKYRPILDKVQSQIMKAEIGVTGVYQVMLETLDEAETAEDKLREELAALKQSLAKVRADAIRDAANQTMCGKAGYDDLHQYANKIEAGL